MGEIVSIAPGGVREALFSENYSLVWEKRIGFAKAAIEAQVVFVAHIVVIMCSSHHSRVVFK